MVEYYEDVFEDNPMAVLDTLRGEDGEVNFEEVAEDPLIAKWEREIASGAQPDFEEGLSTKEKQKLAAEREKFGKAAGKVQQATISDDFTKVAAEMKVATPTQTVDKRFESKFVVPNSPEDIALRRAGMLGRQTPGRSRSPEFLGGGVKRGRR